MVPVTGDQAQVVKDEQGLAAGQGQPFGQGVQAAAELEPAEQADQLGADRIGQRPGAYRPVPGVGRLTSVPGGPWVVANRWSLPGGKRQPAGRRCCRRARTYWAPWVGRRSGRAGRRGDAARAHADGLGDQHRAGPATGVGGIGPGHGALGDRDLQVVVAAARPATRAGVADAERLRHRGTVPEIDVPERPVAGQHLGDSDRPGVGAGVVERLGNRRRRLTA